MIITVGGLKSFSTEFKTMNKFLMLFKFMILLKNFTIQFIKSFRVNMSIKKISFINKNQLQLPHFFPLHSIYLFITIRRSTKGKLF